MSHTTGCVSRSAAFQHIGVVMEQVHLFLLEAAEVVCGEVALPEEWKKLITADVVSRQEDYLSRWYPELNWQKTSDLSWWSANGGSINSLGSLAIVAPALEDSVMRRGVENVIKIHLRRIAARALREWQSLAAYSYLEEVKEIERRMSSGANFLPAYEAALRRIRGIEPFQLPSSFTSEAFQPAA